MGRVAASTERRPLKKPSLVETLEAARAATHAALRRTRDVAVESERLVPADREHEPEGLVAAIARSTPGPITGLIVVCSPRLAEAVAQGLDDEAKDPTLAEASPDGCTPVCVAIEEHLERFHPWYRSEAERTPLDVAQVAARAAVGPSYLLSIETSHGPLFVHVLLPFVEQSVISGTAGSLASLDNREIDELLAELGTSELDVEVELPVDRFAQRLFPGRLLGRATCHKRPVVLLASPNLAHREPRPLEDWTVPVYIVRSGRLLGFESIAHAIVRLPIAGETGLSVLAIDPPRRIEHGQRRGAFRVTPSTPVAAEIRALAQSGGADAPPSFEGDVRDLSLTGARFGAEIADASFLAKGDLVRVRIVLPEPDGAVELPAIVRYTTDSTGRAAQRLIGVEFLRGREWRHFESALDVVRRYVMEQQRGRLGKEAA